MSLPYYKRFPRDFLDGTVGFTLEQKGAYSGVLDLIYMRGGNLPDDPGYIAGQLGCSVRKWNSLRDFLIERGKLQVENGLISNFRADYLLEETRKYRDQKAENRAGSNKNKAEEERASTKRAEIQISEEEKEYKGASAEAADLFEECWKLYQSCPLKAKAQKKKPAKAQWSRSIKRAEPERILKAIGAAVEARSGPQPRKFEDRYPTLPDMWRWLRDDCWADVERELAPVEIESIEPSTWDDAFRAYCANASWPRKLLGPAPHEAGCTAPRDKIAKAEAYLRARNPETADGIVENSLKMEQAA
jgi:uncharacterized protein YdaU (DUF1376 family)